MKQYLELGNDILNNGNLRGDRTGTGTISVFGRQVRYDLRGNVLPLVTTKQMFSRGMFEEHLWTLSGDTNNNTLADKNVHIWDEWAVKEENLLYNDQERALIALKQIPASLLEEDMENDLRRVAHKNEVTSEILDHVKEIFTSYSIPTHRPNPLNVKIGALGPVYGEQWRFWPSNDLIAVPMTLKERVQAARDSLQNSVVITPKSVQIAMQELDEVKPLDLPLEREKELHALLDTDGIPEVAYRQATIDQIAKVIEDLKVRPNSRRIIVSAWNPAAMPDESVSPEQNVINGKAALASCHTLFQFYVQERSWEDILEDVKVAGLVEEYQDFFNYTEKQLLHAGGETVKTYKNRQWMDELKGLTKACRGWLKENGILVDKLSCQLYQRSADFCLGVPFNVASYATLTMMVAQCVDMSPGEFIHTFGDLHVYMNHIDKLEEQLRREPFPLPTLWINPEVKDIFGFNIEDFRIDGYQHHDKVAYPVAK